MILLQTCFVTKMSVKNGVHILYNYTEVHILCTFTDVYIF